MCYNVSVSVEGRLLARRFNAQFAEAKDFSPIYHVSAFSLPLLPVITNRAPGRIQLFQWGLIPGWVKDEETAQKLRLRTLNARSETLRVRPAFRTLIKSKRCLVLVNGYYEWQEVNRKKYPYYIYLKDRKPFALAGLWDTWVDVRTRTIHSTFSVITTKANSLLARIHNTTKRMPVALGPDQEKEWLRNDLPAERVNALLECREDGRFTAHTISKLITAREKNNNVPEVTREFHYKELAALSEKQHALR